MKKTYIAIIVFSLFLFTIIAYVSLNNNPSPLPPAKQNNETSLRYDSTTAQPLNIDSIANYLENCSNNSTYRDDCVIDQNISEKDIAKLKLIQNIKGNLFNSGIPKYTETVWSFRYQRIIVRKNNEAISIWKSNNNYFITFSSGMVDVPAYQQSNTYLIEPLDKQTETQLRQ